MNAAARLIESLSPADLSAEPICSIGRNLVYLFRYPLTFAMNIRSNLLRIVFASLSTALLAAAAPAHAAYPDRPVRWIIPAAAGGAADATARIVAAAVTQRWGQPIVIDNRPGAAGVIAYEALAKAPPDGYTIAQSGLSTFVVANLVARKLPYRPAEDFTHIAMLFTTINLLGVNPGLPVKTVPELVAYARAHPNELFYGSSGTGSALHVITELFRQSAGIQMTHVPYKSTQAAEMDLAGGQLQLMISNISSMEPNVRAGRIRALATTGPKRSPLLPNIPTMAEAGVPAAEMITWGGISGPARMPQAVVDRIHAEFTAVLADPKVIRQLADLGADAAPMSLQKFNELIQSDFQRWGAVVKANHIATD